MKAHNIDDVEGNSLHLLTVSLVTSHQWAITILEDLFYGPW